MPGILSKGVELGYSKTIPATTYTKIDNLQEFPDLGGNPSTVDVTTLEDSMMHYINGLKDTGELTFTFLYDNSGASSNYRVIRGLEEDGAVVAWQVSFPDTTKVAFTGQVTTNITGKGVNEALQFTATIAINSDMTVTNPS